MSMQEDILAASMIVKEAFGDYASGRSVVIYFAAATDSPLLQGYFLPTDHGDYGINRLKDTSQVQSKILQQLDMYVELGIIKPYQISPSYTSSVDIVIGVSSFSQAKLSAGTLGATVSTNVDSSDSFRESAILFDDSLLNNNDSDISNMLIFHEIAHALGLRDLHTVGLTGRYDSYKYSSMSYNPHPSLSATDAPTSLMLLDYLAFDQQGLLYKKDYQAGDTPYHWNKDEKVLHTIYDTGGKDVISAQDHERNTIIDLREGHFSSYGKSDKGTEVPVENLAIAYGTIIENAIGGNGNDVLIGNTTGNGLTGGDGNDILYGDGSSYNPAEWQFSSEHKSAYLATIDNSVVNLDDDDTLKGGKGSDHLFGVTGDDILDGGEGADILEGGQGKDTYVFDGNFGRDIVIDGDGDGTIVINGITLNKFEQVEGTDVVYRDDKKNPQFEIIKINEGSTTSLLIMPLGPRTNSGSVIVKNWSDGNLGLQLSTPEAEAPDMTGIITRNGNSSDNSISYANYMQDRPDYNLGEYKGLSVNGNEGHDLIMGFLQGNDTLLGGDGNDVISGGFTTYIGGSQLLPLLEKTGKDFIDGGKGDDFIVVSAQGSVAHGGDDNDALTAGYAMYTTTYNVTGNDSHGAITRDQVWSDIRGLLDFKIESEFTNNLHTYSHQPGVFNDISNVYKEHVGVTSGEKFVLGLADNSYNFTYNYGVNNGIIVPRIDSPLFHFFAPIKPAAGHDLAEFANVKGANLYGDKGEDTLSGGIYSDYLSGGDDADTLIGGAGHDILDGGEGDDKIFGDEGNDIIIGGAGNDVLIGSYVSLRDGALDDDIIYGGDGDDYLEGGNGNDYLDGGSGVDTFSGGKGNDTIVGSVGEIAAGGGDDDIYIVDFAVIPQANKSAKTSSLVTSSIQYSKEQTSTLTIVDTEGSNTLALVGDGGFESISLLSVGNDLIVQQNGGRIYIQGGLNGAISQIVQGDSVDAIATGSATSHSSLNNLLLSNLASAVTRTASTSGTELVGGLLNDTLTAHTDGSILIGGRGNDVLKGGLGNDIYVLRVGDGQDTLSETGGTNKIKLAEGITADQVSLRRDNGNLLLMVTTGESITVSGMFNTSTGAVIESKAIQSIEFSDGDVWDSAQILLEITKGIKLVGTDLPDTLRGFEFGDTLDGGLGNDVLFGGDGDDVLLGGDGNDILHGEAGDDTLTGGVGNDTLRGEAGNDIYQFGKGDGLDQIFFTSSNIGYEDTLVFSDGVLPADVKLMRSNQDLKLIIESTGDSVSLKNYFSEATDSIIKKVVFSDDTEWNSSYITANVASSSSGNDVLIGDSGANSLSGLEGNDLLVGNAGDDHLNGNAGSDTVIGGLGDDTLNGGNGADTYIFNSGDGKDLIYEYGNDAGISNTISFGEGISESNIKIGQNQMDLVLLIGDSGDQITIYDYYKSYSTPPDFDLLFVDGAVSLKEFHHRKVIDAFFTADGDDVVLGTLGNDLVHGLEGDDTISGGSLGSDTLIGGQGNDYLCGGVGVDTYLFNSGDGQDRIEDQSANSNEFNQIIFGDGVDRDSISFGRSHYDLTMFYGDQADSITVQRFFEADYNFSSYLMYFQNSSEAPITLPELLQISDKRILTPTDNADNISGFNGNELIQGLDGDDWLYGEGGDDTLVGGKGDDYIFGGLGFNTYVLNRDDGKDTINPLFGGNNESPFSFGGRVVFAEGITGDDVSFSISNDFVSVTYGEGDSVSLRIPTLGTQGFISFEEQMNAVAGWELVIDNETVSLRELIDSTNNISSRIRDFKTYGRDVYGTSWNEIIDFGSSQIAVTLWGADGNDLLIGGTKNDDLIGGSGNDTLDGGLFSHDYLSGGVGDDIYKYSYGNGNDVIYETSGLDKIEFGSGILPNEVAVTRTNSSANMADGKGTDLVLTFTNGQFLTIKNVFTLSSGATIAGNVVEEFEFSDGSNWTFEQVLNQIAGGDLIAPPKPSASFNDAGSIIQGVAEPGSLVEAKNASAIVLGSAIANAAHGSYSISLHTALINNETINVSAKDTAGNVSDITVTNAPDYTAPEKTTVFHFSELGTFINGNAEAGSLVEAKDVFGLLLGSARVSAGSDSYSLQFNVALNNGEVINLTVKDLAGNTSPVTTIVAPDKVAPLPPSAEFDLAGKVIAGFAEAGSRVIVKNSSGVELKNAIADVTTGAYSITLTTALINKETVNVTARDAAGNISAIKAIIAPDKTAPSIPTANFDAAGLVITGVAEAGSTVIVKNAAGTELKTATANATTGAYSITLTTALINKETVNVTAKDTAGNISAIKALIAPDKTAPIAPSAAIDVTRKIITGVAEASSIVEVRNTSGAVLGSFTAHATTGAYSITLGTALAVNQTVNVTARDVAGNISLVKAVIASGVTDITPPAIPTASFDVAGKTISGVAEAGSVVVVKNANNTSTLGTVTAHATTGAYSISLVTALINKETVNITATDAAGNVSVARAIVAPDVATPDPTAIIIQAENYSSMSGVWNESTADVGGGQNTGNINTGDWMAYNNIAFSVPTEGVYKITYRVASLNGGGRLALRELGNESTLGSIAIPKTGAWQSWVDVTQEITLSGGTHNFKLYAESGGFNINWFKLEPIVATAPITPDTTPPVQPTAIFDSVGKVISGVAEAGSVVVVKNANNTSTLGTVAADATTGAYSITLVTALINKETVNVSATDVAGNISLIKAIIAPDKTAPGAPTVNLDIASKIVSGVAEAGSSVTVKDSEGQTLGIVQANATTGAYSVSFTQTLIVGQSIFTFATDGAGNISDVTATPIIVNSDPISAESGLRGSYYGYHQPTNGNVNLVNLAQVLGLINGREPDATFIAKDIQYGRAGPTALGMGINLQNFLKADATSLSRDPGDTSDAILRLDGKIQLSAGTYSFRVRADDGYSIKVNGVVVAEYALNQAATTRTHSTFTVAQSGLQDIEIIYWDSGWDHILNVELANTATGIYAYLDESILFQPSATVPVAMVAETNRPRTDYEGVHYYSSNDALIQAMASFVSGSGVDTRYRSTQLEQSSLVIAVGS